MSKISTEVPEFTPGTMISLLQNLASFEPEDIDSDTVNLRFEDAAGNDTGWDVSIVDTARQAADVIRYLLDQLEEERLRAQSAYRSWVQAVKGMGEAEKELIELRGKQQPFAYVFDDRAGNLQVTRYKPNLAHDHKVEIVELFANPPKPVVVLPEPYCDGTGTEWYRKECILVNLKKAGVKPTHDDQTVLP